MDILILVAKFLSLMFGIAYSVSVLGTMIHGNAVGQSKMYLMSISVSSFIFLQWIV